MLQDLIKALDGMKVVDLGQYLEEHMPVHPSHSRFFRMLWHSPAFGDICTDYQIIMNEHNGTHVDSYRHYIQEDGYEWIDEIPLEKFNGTFVCIDATFMTANETLSVEAIKEHEAKYGEIQKDDIVLIDTGWMSKWAVRPNDYEVSHDYPGLGKESAEYLVEEKGIKMVGTDCIGIDCFNAGTDPAHVELLSHKVPIVENLCNLGQLHGKRGYFCMLPLKIKTGTASPVRPVALIDA